MNKIFSFLRNNVEIFLIISLLFSFFAPYLFTRDWTGIDFSTTGEVGDTIGGLTSPFLNLIGIILLYLTLKEQIETSKEQKDFDTITGLFNTVKTDFENLEFYKKEDNITAHKGAKAIFEISNILKKSDNILNDVDEPSLMAFCLSFDFLTSNFIRLVKKNKKSCVSIEEKKEIYEKLIALKIPIDLFRNASQIYLTKRSELYQGKLGSNIDQYIGLIGISQNAFNKVFNDNEPK